MSRTLVRNRKARHDYHVLETFEAGIELTGTETKSCRAANASLSEAYAKIVDGEVWLTDAHIAHYEQGNRNNHDPKRPRKLLMHKREIRRLAQQVDAKGLTLVPLSLYFKGPRIKVELGLCKGKNVHDKRHDMKRRMDEQEVRRAVDAVR